MIIDAHTHTFPDRIAEHTIDKLSHDGGIRPFTGGTLRELADSSKRAGIDLSLILPVATSASQVIKVNDASARINEDSGSEPVFSIGCMHPDFPDYKKELRRIRDLGLRGIKLHPYYQDTCIDDIRYLRILSEAAELGLVVVTHSGLDVGYPGLVRCSPRMCLNAVHEVGEFPFILAHMGGWNSWEEALDLLPGTGVYLDTAFSCIPYYPRDPMEYADAEPMMPDELFLRFVDTFGADHILFGTDSPWADQSEFVRRIARMPLSDVQKTKILGENAREVFSL